MKKIEEFKKDLYVGEVGEYFCDYDNGYLCDIITEIADNNVDVYTYDLFEWAKTNYDIIEEANAEMGTPNDMLAQIRQGQFLYYERDLYENLHDVVLFRLYNYIEKDLKIEELTEEQADKIEYLNLDDNNERLENLIDEVNEILNNKIEE